MRLFLYPEKDSIENTSVKTPLNSVDFTSTFILAERDLGFSFAKFKMADQCEATETNDDNKPIKSLKRLFALIQFHLMWQILAKFSLRPYLSLSKFRKRKRQFLCCVHLLHKAGS